MERYLIEAYAVTTPVAKRKFPEDVLHHSDVRIIIKKITTKISGRTEEQYEKYLAKHPETTGKDFYINPIKKEVKYGTNTNSILIPFNGQIHAAFGVAVGGMAGCLFNSVISVGEDKTKTKK